MDSAGLIVASRRAAAVMVTLLGADRDDAAVSTGVAWLTDASAFVADAVLGAGVRAPSSGTGLVQQTWKPDIDDRLRTVTGGTAVPWRAEALTVLTHTMLVATLRAGDNGSAVLAFESREANASPELGTCAFAEAVVRAAARFLFGA